MPTTERRLLTDAQLAELLGVSRAHVHNLRRAGLPSIAIGRSRRYDPDACLGYLAEHGADAGRKAS